MPGVYEVNDAFLRAAVNAPKGYLKKLSEQFKAVLVPASESSAHSVFTIAQPYRNGDDSDVQETVAKALKKQVPTNPLSRMSGYVGVLDSARTVIPDSPFEHVRVFQSIFFLGNDNGILGMAATEAMRALPKNERCDGILGPVALVYSTFVETKKDGEFEVFLDAPDMTPEDVRLALAAGRARVETRYRDAGL